MHTSEPCRVIDPQTALDCVGPGRHLPAPGRLGPAPPVQGRAVSSLGAERRGRRPGRGDAQSGHAQRGDEPARCGHARRLGERPLLGDPGPFGPASPGLGQTPPLGRASPRGSLFSGGSAGVDAKIRRASSLTLFTTIKKKKKKIPRSFGLWAFPSLMGFRHLPFATDFIFLFPNHICPPALTKLCQRREISSWLVSTPHVFTQHNSHQFPKPQELGQRQRQGHFCS